MSRPWVRAALVGIAMAMTPMLVHAATYDVAILASDVVFAPETFFLGDTVRLYVRVKNVGDRDVQGNVFFSENGTAIGAPPFSVRARGAEEEVWVDWQPATIGDRQIFLRVVTAPETRDEDLSNNEMIVPITIDRDTDGDRVGDRVDADDDGDGLPDAWEEAHGLNPRDAADARRDPDGDGATTIEEYRAGTDPFAAPPPPAVRSGASSGSDPTPRSMIASSSASSPSVPANVRTVAAPTQKLKRRPLPPPASATPASDPAPATNAAPAAMPAPSRTPTAPPSASDRMPPPGGDPVPTARDDAGLIPIGRASIATQLESLLGAPMRSRGVFPLIMAALTIVAFGGAYFFFRRARRS
ncbi:hypothetical protein HY632_02225 [Candidatus Uhrbacteria bacterium]|nr:hypothetical protein [Candidatus Uhrbacteria bacterium]